LAGKYDKALKLIDSIPGAASCSFAQTLAMPSFERKLQAAAIYISCAAAVREENLLSKQPGRLQIVKAAVKPIFSVTAFL